MPPGYTRTDRIPQDVTDISDASQLLRYAAAGQLEPLLRRGFSQGKIAQGAGFGSVSRNAGPVLSLALRKGFTAAQLHGLDEVIGVLAPDADGTGGLSSLGLRLSSERRDKTMKSSLAAHVPPSWTRRILTDPPVGQVGVLMQASALLSEFMAAERMGAADIVAAILDRYKWDFDLLVRQLILISVGPPSLGNYDAQTLLGILASYAFEPMRDRLESQLRYSPMGFRVWPAITKLVTLSNDSEHAEALRFWVRRLIRDAEGLRARSLYAGSGSDLELAITVPASWSPPDDDWVGEALRSRVRNNEATIRERGTAAMGLWQRVISEGRPNLKQTQDDLRDLITEFRNPESRPDAAAGLRWLAATLEHVIENKESVCNDWPDIDEPWFRHVDEAAGELDNVGIPTHLVTGTKSLFRHMILQNAGVYRRQAIETVVTSGLNEPVARALGSLLLAEKSEGWMRVRALFALGLLQRRDAFVEADLSNAALRAYQNLKSDEGPDNVIPPRSHVTELHAALFAIGDCFGTSGEEGRARSTRERLRPVLTELANMEGDRALVLRRASRAAAYLLIVTAQPRIGEEKDLSQELLEDLAHSEDPVTAKLSSWALSFRFAPDGAVRPFLAAAEYGELDDSPY